MLAIVSISIFEHKSFRNRSPSKINIHVPSTAEDQFFREELTPKGAMPLSPPPPDSKVDNTPDCGAASDNTSVKPASPSKTEESETEHKKDAIPEQGQAKEGDCHELTNDKW